MDTRVNEIRLEHWKKIISEQLSSGMTIKSWCKQYGITPRQFYYWKKKLINQALEHASDKRDDAFFPVPVQSNVTSVSSDTSVVFTELIEPESSIPDHTEHETVVLQDGLRIQFGSFSVTTGRCVDEVSLEKVLRVISHVQ